MKKYFFPILLIIFFPAAVLGEMSSPNYKIYFDAIGVNGGDLTTSTSYSLSDTIGEISAETIGGSSYTLKGGFQAADTGSISFSLSNNSLDLGVLDPAKVSTATTTASVTTEEAGYYLSIAHVTGSMPAAVSGGEVMAGVEGYGLSSVGSNSVVSGDVPVSEGLILSESDTPVIGNETTLVFKAAMSSASTPGKYSQSLDIIATAN